MDRDDDDEEEPFCRVRLAVCTVLAEALIAEIEKWSSENDKGLVDDDGSDEDYQHDLEVFKDELEMLELEVELDESPRTRIEGTLNVKAEYKGNGNSEKITITDDIFISQEKVEWLVKVDEELADADQKVKERIGARELEMLELEQELDEFELLELELELDEPEVLEFEPDFDELEMLELELELDELNGISPQGS